MTPTRRAFATGLCLALTLAAAGLRPDAARAAEITVEHARGEITVPRTPETVLVFDLAALDTLDALGVEVDGVPAGPKPAHLAGYDADGHAKVGSLFEPDYEAVNAADPDLIVVAGRSSAKYAELSEIAPTIDLTVDQDAYLASARAHIRTLGRIFDRSDAAAERLAALDAAIAALRDDAANIGKGLLILTTGGRMSAYGPGSRFGLLHEEFGIPPAAPDLDAAVHGQAISHEFILETDPDWLFVIDRDSAIGHEGEAARELLDNPLVTETTAWQRDQVVYLDAANWYLAGAGLRALEMTVDEVRAAIAGH